MLFKTDEERRAFFTRAEQDPSSVAYGSALLHAATTPLGVWNQEPGLRSDTARILSFETARYVDEVLSGTRRPPLPELIEVSPAFQKGYATARRIADQKLCDDLRTNGAEAIADAIASERGVGIPVRNDPFAPLVRSLIEGDNRPLVRMRTATFISRVLDETSDECALLERMLMSPFPA